jgi:hypothetical protein
MSTGERLSIHEPINTTLQRAFIDKTVELIPLLIPQLPPPPIDDGLGEQVVLPIIYMGHFHIEDKVVAVSTQADPPDPEYSEASVEVSWRSPEQPDVLHEQLFNVTSVGGESRPYYEEYEMRWDVATQRFAQIPPVGGVRVPNWDCSDPASYKPFTDALLLINEARQRAAELERQFGINTTTFNQPRFDEVMYLLNQATAATVQR